LKIQGNTKEGKRKMMKKGRLIEELEEAGVIDKNVQLEPNKASSREYSIQ
jgi:hypothetical protein